MLCAIEIHIDGKWRSIARFIPLAGQTDRGHAGCGGHLEYEEQYVLDHFQALLPAVSLRVPVGFIVDRYERWPAFMLDLLPTGAGRRGWLERLGLQDGPAADWQLLLHGARHPVGWLRVRGEESSPEAPGPGFSRQEIAELAQGFLEYAIERGASVAGSSDVQGESPKLLLTEDAEGMLHADGALPDGQAIRHWLVKFARGRSESDKRILRNEAGYLRLAGLLGADVYGEPALCSERALFIPRFDRRVAGSRVIRHGLESFASAAGTSEFGVRANHAEHCRIITGYSSSPAVDLLEYLRRDILNVCLGNTDNHPRNHAFLKTGAGDVRLSPLFDFAPMFIDPDGIARVTRWHSELERLGQPDWSKVAMYFANLDKGPEALRVAELMGMLADRFGRISHLAAEAGVDTDIIGLLARKTDENRRLLDKAARGVSHG